MSIKHFWISTALGLAIVPALAQAQTNWPAAGPARPSGPGAVTEWTYLPGPPEVVAAAMTEQAMWSHDGRYALAVRQRLTFRSMEDIHMDPSIVLWSAATRTSTVVWRVESPEYRVASLAWMPGSSVALAGVTSQNREGGSMSSIWRIDARRATAAQITPPTPSAALGVDATVSVSPRLPLAVVYGHDEQGTYVRSLDQSGKLSREFRLDGAEPFLMGWSKDGSTVYLPAVRVPQAGEDLPARIFASFRVDTLEIGSTHVAPEIAGEDPPGSFPFLVAQSETDVASERPTAAKDAGPAAAQPSKLPAVPALTTTPWSETKVRPLWLLQSRGKEMERTLIAADVSNFVVSPRGDAVLYMNREGCFVAPLIRVDRAQMEKARQAAQRSMLLNNGKQIAIALLMYATDNEDAYPPEGTDLRTLLEPYSKTSDIFNGLSGPGDGFVYTFGGGPMAAVEDPSNAELGFIPAPGGRVAVYVDGHVKFLPAGEGMP